MANIDHEAVITPADDAPEAMIRLEGVSKIYDGTTAPAVSDLTLDIPKGEILVLVGPSGCGKSTTLRLINRMIEPTSGRIIFDGEDVTSVNADRLRRRIGYVIQQIGLFPHQTIAQNIATVPKMLGWDRKQIGSRVDELLDMVGMDPSVYRNRYPKELSGGQAQRVGVARALGGDPSVMLMDEPFGAIDPITRDRLQNEFVRLQAELRKTIVFVTHDIDEAIKMGDRIAILRDHSKIAQFDTPERILAFPVDDFVREFIGSGATLKGLNLARVREVPYADVAIFAHDTPREEARRILAASTWRWAMVTDEQGRPGSWVDEARLASSSSSILDAGVPVKVQVEPHATMRDALEEMLLSSAGHVSVVDPDGKLLGIIAIESLTEVINRMQNEARRHVEQQAAAS